MEIPPRPVKDRQCHPYKRDGDTTERDIEVADLMQVVKPIEAASFQCRDDDIYDPSSEKEKGQAGGNEPAGQQEELDLFLHSMSVILPG